MYLYTKTYILLYHYGVDVLTNNPVLLTLYYNFIDIHTHYALPVWGQWPHNQRLPRAVGVHVLPNHNVLLTLNHNCIDLHRHYGIPVWGQCPRNHRLLTLYHHFIYLALYDHTHFMLCHYVVHAQQSTSC